MRLAQIEKDIDELKQKTTDNTNAAENIEETAERVKQAATEAKQVGTDLRNENLLLL